MGRKAPRNLYKLDFTDTPYGQADDDGDPLEVTMTGLSMGEALESVELENLFDPNATNIAEQAQVVRRMIDLFGAHLVSWNLEAENGDPISATPAALLAQDPVFLFDVIKAYRTAVMAVGKPQLPASSSGGQSVVEQSIPMDIPSENPPNSSAPKSPSTSLSASPATPSPASKPSPPS